MAGETVKTEAVCLGIRPWSRTSHVVTWLTPTGKVTTVVKGAVRPKSAFLGQYDANYTCEIVYYAGGRGDVHALRECTPLNLREGLRGRYRACVLAEYFRFLCGRLAPTGPDAADWFTLLVRALDELAGDSPQKTGDSPQVVGDSPSHLGDSPLKLVRFELEVLKLAGLSPDFSGFDASAAWMPFSVETGSFTAAGSCRTIRIVRETAEFLNNPRILPKNQNTPLDAARVLGVFYQFHLDSASDVRRSVLRIISNIE